MNLLKSFIYHTALPMVGKLLSIQNNFPQVIYYHDIVKGEGKSFMRINESVFCNQMLFLKKKGYQTLLFSEVKSSPIKSPCVLITFDDGWISNYNVIFKFMQKHQLKYNVFLAAGKINQDTDYLTWRMVKTMADSGLVEFGAHTFDHVNMSDISSVDCLRQVEMANAVISEHTGKAVNSFCFPYGQYSPESLTFLAKYYNNLYTSDLGYTYLQDYTTVIWRRVAISTDDCIRIFANKLNGAYNIMETLVKWR